ncbi:MAG TPA: HAMP domain-containing sensor histidine kinase [Candidatus Binataceae bacterium]|nr:HAMP domain-containing sensor histidine kinase [Candidatus Binataceae bacterium]
MRNNSRGRSGKRSPRAVPSAKPSSLLYNRRADGEAWTEHLRLAALASLTHELRTPLQVLHGNLDRLKHEAPDNLPARWHQMLERMNVDVCEFTRIVENIMVFVLDDPSKEVRAKVPTRELIDDVMPLIEAVNHDKQLALQVDLDEAPPVVHAPYRPLRLILANLGVNAVRFTDRGSVKIAIRQAGKLDRPEVAFEVADTGRGFGAELRDGLFAPFAQLASSQHPGLRSLGLDLSVVKRCVASLDGNLEAHSVPGQGSRFVVRFPVPAHGVTSQIS